MKLAPTYRIAVALLCFAAMFMAAVTASHAAPIDFNTFTTEQYDNSNFSDSSTWNVGPSDTVTQPASQNPNAAVFYGPATLGVNNFFSGTLVNSMDDDFVGFVFGFQPGDATNFSADYLLVDWKMATQNSPDFMGGTTVNADHTTQETALVGLALSRVTGVPTADEFWGHANQGEPVNGAGGVDELLRANTLGNTGYTTNDFEILWTTDRLTVWIDDTLELDYTGPFVPTTGRFGLYQAYEQGFTFQNVDAVAITPVPTALPIGLLGLAGVAYLRRRNRRDDATQDAA